MKFIKIGNIAVNADQVRAFGKDKDTIIVYFIDKQIDKLKQKTEEQAQIIFDLAYEAVK